MQGFDKAAISGHIDVAFMAKLITDRRGSHGTGKMGGDQTETGCRNLAPAE